MKKVLFCISFGDSDDIEIEQWMTIDKLPTIGQLLWLQESDDQTRTETDYVDVYLERPSDKAYSVVIFEAIELDEQYHMRVIYPNVAHNLVFAYPDDCPAYRLRYAREPKVGDTLDWGIYEYTVTSVKDLGNTLYQITTKRLG